LFKLIHGPFNQHRATTAGIGQQAPDDHARQQRRATQRQGQPTCQGEDRWQQQERFGTRRRTGRRAS